MLIFLLLIYLSIDSNDCRYIYSSSGIRHNVRPVYYLVKSPAKDFNPFIPERFEVVATTTSKACIPPNNVCGCNNDCPSYHKCGEEMDDCGYKVCKRIAEDTTTRFPITPGIRQLPRRNDKLEQDCGMSTCDQCAIPQLCLSGNQCSPCVTCEEVFQIFKICKRISDVTTAVVTIETTTHTTKKHYETEEIITDSTRNPIDEFGIYVAPMTNDVTKTTTNEEMISETNTKLQTAQFTTETIHVTNQPLTKTEESRTPKKDTTTESPNTIDNFSGNGSGDDDDDEDFSFKVETPRIIPSTEITVRPTETTLLTNPAPTVTEETQTIHQVTTITTMPSTGITGEPVKTNIVTNQTPTATEETETPKKDTVNKATTQSLGTIDNFSGSGSGDDDDDENFSFNDETTTTIPSTVKPVKTTLVTKQTPTATEETQTIKQVTTTTVIPLTTTTVPPVRTTLTVNKTPKVTEETHTPKKDTTIQSTTQSLTTIDNLSGAGSGDDDDDEDFSFKDDKNQTSRDVPNATNGGGLNKRDDSINMTTSVALSTEFSGTPTELPKKPSELTIKSVPTTLQSFPVPKESTIISSTTVEDEFSNKTPLNDITTTTVISKVNKNGTSTDIIEGSGSGDQENTDSEEIYSSESGIVPKEADIKESNDESGIIKDSEDNKQTELGSKIGIEKPNKKSSNDYYFVVDDYDDPDLVPRISEKNKNETATRNRVAKKKEKRTKSRANKKKENLVQRNY